MFMLCSCRKGVFPPFVTQITPAHTISYKEIPHYYNITGFLCVSVATWIHCCYDTFQMFLLRLDPLLFHYNLTKLSEAGFHRWSFREGWGQCETSPLPLLA